MPAVQLARLKEQTTELAWAFARPLEFRKKLASLLDAYADRAFRPGQAVKTRTLLPTYRVVPLVLRHLEQEIGRLCAEQPTAALALVDVLWADDYLEPRQLAASLLGRISLTPPEPVLERLLAWSSPEQDDQLQAALLQQGSARVRKETPDRWLEIVEQWLARPDVPARAMGLVALVPMITDRGYENLPRVFRLLAPVIESTPPDLQTDLQINLNALAQRSPTETAYFLRQMLTTASTSTVVRLVRRCLPLFPEEQQIGLRKALVNRSARQI